MCLDSLEAAYRIAAKHSSVSQAKQKKTYDRKVRGASVQVGDRVLVRNVAFSGPHNLADRWQESVYIVQEQPDKSIPVFKLHCDDGQGRSLVLHRNMLLPINSVEEINQVGKTMSSKGPQSQDKISTDPDLGLRNEDSSAGAVQLPVYPILEGSSSESSVDAPPQADDSPSVSQEQHLIDKNLDREAVDIMDTEAVDLVESEGDNQHSSAEQEERHSSGERTSASEPASVSSPVEDSTTDDEVEDSSTSEERSLPRRSSRNRLPNSRYDPNIFILAQRAKRKAAHRANVKKQTVVLRECLRAILNT